MINRRKNICFHDKVQWTKAEQHDNLPTMTTLKISYKIGMFAMETMLKPNTFNLLIGLRSSGTTRLALCMAEYLHSKNSECVVFVSDKVHEALYKKYYKFVFLDSDIVEKDILIALADRLNNVTVIYDKRNPTDDNALLKALENFNITVMMCMPYSIGMRPEVKNRVNNVFMLDAGDKSKIYSRFVKGYSLNLFSSVVSETKDIIVISPQSEQLNIMVNHPSFPPEPSERIGFNVSSHTDVNNNIHNDNVLPIKNMLYEVSHINSLITKYMLNVPEHQNSKLIELFTKIVVCNKDIINITKTLK
jgi:hypothetical protein